MFLIPVDQVKVRLMALLEYMVSKLDSSFTILSHIISTVELSLEERIL